MAEFSKKTVEPFPPHLHFPSGIEAEKFNEVLLGLLTAVDWSRFIAQPPRSASQLHPRVHELLQRNNAPTGVRIAADEYVGLIRKYAHLIIESGRVAETRALHSQEPREEDPEIELTAALINDFFKDSEMGSALLKSYRENIALLWPANDNSFVEKPAVVFKTEHYVRRVLVYLLKQKLRIPPLTPAEKMILVQASKMAHSGKPYEDVVKAVRNNGERLLEEIGRYLHEGTPQRTCDQLNVMRAEILDAVKYIVKNPLGFPI